MGTIKKIGTLIQPILRNRTFVEAKIGKLTAPGENYGSLILSLDVVLKDGNQKIEHEYLVAKMPPSNPLVRKMFNINYTFPNEVAFYQTIIPTLYDFQKEHSTDCLLDAVPDFCNARHSLDPAQKLDNDAVLVIKNIKYDGYLTFDRTQGFDLTPTKVILGKLAELHSTALAFKLQKQEVFEKKFRPHLQQFTVFEVEDDSNSSIIKSIINMIKDERIASNHMEKITKLLIDGSVMITKKNTLSTHQQYNTIAHCDLWTNNIMVKQTNGEITAIKFIDFQLYEYTSLTRDVIFFLSTSVNPEILGQEFDNLLLFYYATFIKFLQKLECDVSMYSFDSFISNLKFYLQYSEFFHIMVMLGPIFAQDKDVKEVEEMDLEDMTHHGDAVPEKAKKRAVFLLNEFVKRNWLW